MLKYKIDIVIPAYNEELSIPKVIAEIPKDIIRNIVVCNNGSTDKTEEVAKKSGAIVVTETRKGYGYACLKAIEYIENLPIPPDILVFIDADFSDCADELMILVSPIMKGDIDLVIGSRALGNREKGSMTVPQLFGNWLATFLIDKLYNYKFTDLGPFRAIRWKAYQELNMQDKTFGWTVEMQIKCAKQKLNCVEVPVKYRKRIGKSKVSGTIKGTIMAGYKILWMIFKSIERN